MSCCNCDCAGDAKASRRKTAVLICTAAFLLTLWGAVAWVTTSSLDANANEPAEPPALLGPGETVPDFEAILADGSTFNIKDYQDKIVVLDFWATWCGPCRAAFPHIDKVREQTADQDVVVIALNAWEPKAAFDRYLEGEGSRFGFTFAHDPAGRDRKTSIPATLFNVRSFPTTFVIGKDGVIAASFAGYPEGQTPLEDALRGLGVEIN